MDSEPNNQSTPDHCQPSSGQSSQPSSNQSSQPSSNQSSQPSSSQPSSNQSSQPSSNQSSQPSSSDPCQPFVLSTKSKTISFNELIQNSDSFDSKVCQFKTDDNRIKTIVEGNKEKADIIEAHANDTRVILHNRVIKLIENFLGFKKKWGTPKEEEALKGVTTVPLFIKRMLEKRPMVFFGSHDITLLRGEGYPDFNAWNLIASEKEDESLTVKDYMTYDEIAISALIGVSVPTFFINSGSRGNSGYASEDPTSFQEEGVYIALTGARFEKLDKMESLFMYVTDQHNPENGYGKTEPTDKKLEAKRELLKIWAKFYDIGTDYFPSFEELMALYQKKDKTPEETAFLSQYHYTSGRNSFFLNKYVYKKRLELSILPFLLDADYRAHQAKKKAYLHVVGLGLGVWQVLSDQAGWMLSVYSDLIQHYKKNLQNISDINFSWFPDQSQLPGAIDNQLEGINIHFTKRDPAEKLEEGKLLIAMYAWDGNAFPGNEYWRGMLQASGDPAAACCSTIAELQNPYINTPFVESIFGFGNEEFVVKNVN